MQTHTGEHNSSSAVCELLMPASMKPIGHKMPSNTSIGHICAAVFTYQRTGSPGARTASPPSLYTYTTWRAERNESAEHCDMDEIQQDVAEGWMCTFASREVKYDNVCLHKTRRAIARERWEGAGGRPTAVKCFKGVFISIYKLADARCSQITGLALSLLQKLSHFFVQILFYIHFCRINVWLA